MAFSIMALIDLEATAEHRTKRDLQTYKGWLMDREQESWFAINKLNLVRITDVQLKAMSAHELRRLLTS